MSNDNPEINCELVVIGAGMAGMASAMFASNRGISTLQVGITSGIIFASGLIDLMGVHPISEGKIWENPWKAIDALIHDIPNHPFARINKDDIHKALEEFLAFMNDAGLPYCRHKNRNAKIIMPVGTVKHTWCVPKTMWNGVLALDKKSPCLIIDIRGLRGFSARQITETLKISWPDLRHARISIPNTDHLEEVYAEPVARSLSLYENRKALAKIVIPHLKDARMVGFPAIFGINDSVEIYRDLQDLIGVPIFEIPTMPPSITGLRIKETFESQLSKKGVRLLLQKKVLKVNRNKGGFVLDIGGPDTEYTVKAKGIILASGRFLGRGLHADRKQIRESIFDLPVFQVGERTKWHNHNFLDPKGHLINMAGLEIDNMFRPLNSSGKPAFKTLFAAGSILAHQDWMRMKCGSGLAIASAFAAVNAFKERNRSKVQGSGFKVR
ncbi:MAG: glycerol-3-phosphate dehydrogenase subunit GlpB [Deltaproteobacteria bacterium]|nr:glycerol-3-phosphate dehydrogenase subunit GlpB [Deltaproteobacteria bacterium]